MTTLHIEPLGPAIGARVAGLSLAAPLDPDRKSVV